MSFPSLVSKFIFDWSNFWGAGIKIQQTKMFVMCQRFSDYFCFGLVWQYSINQNKSNKGRFKVMATWSAVFLAWTNMFWTWVKTKIGFLGPVQKKSP